MCRIKNIQQITITWGFRKRTLKECTEELIVFLERLKRFDNRLSEWYRTDSSKKAALKNKVELEYDFIKRLFCNHCDDSEYPQLSYKLSLWNGNSLDSLAYGIFLTIGGSKIGNNMVQFTFPYEGEIFDSYSKNENWEALLNLFIDHWNPEFYYDQNN
ncbi:Imm52 family immunity protein [Tenacibaculum sp. 190524A05c]|uniref:Uncharacterized protein n=1 Tax=Tenacibaculum platacis TaxID=3137852 RepID=A0ABM9NU95_9FLAO